MALGRVEALLDLDLIACYVEKVGNEVGINFRRHINQGRACVEDCLNAVFELECVVATISLIFANSCHLFANPDACRPIIHPVHVVLKRQPDKICKIAHVLLFDCAKIDKRRKSLFLLFFLAGHVNSKNVGV